MEIRKAKADEIDYLMEMIDHSRELMRSSGNTIRWTYGYPQRELILNDIKDNQQFVIEENGELVGTFCLIIGEDPNYKIIENGTWLNEEKYGVIHRLASNGKAKGLARFCFEWSFQQIPNIRIDTHETNVAMQKVLEKLGYKKCGIIYVSDGTPRLAFQKINDD